jgi:glutamate/tyrosine decarboxylase-like PLP-dependent enzyme
MERPPALAAPERFVGMDQADSVSLDAHKWLYQPLDCSLLFFRDEAAARAAFGFAADYVKTTTDPIEGFAFFDQTIELSRRFRALKLWLSIRYHGLAAFRAAIIENLEQARLLKDLINDAPWLELLAPVELSAVCFRCVTGEAGGLDELNEAVLHHVNQSGRVWLSNAQVAGKVGLRACITNHRTTESDIRAIIDEVRSAAELAGARLLRSDQPHVAWMPERESSFPFRLGST